jgi:hypothetical protein
MPHSLLIVRPVNPQKPAFGIVKATVYSKNNRKKG